ncbi:MAG: carbon monoxide dehydrogenase accessory protein CooC [Acidimicrobiales bacterium]
MAFVGKGGVGKSAIAGTFARALARAGRSVLVLDSDPMPGLAFTLGMEATDASIPDEATEEREEGEEGPRYRLRAGLTASDAVEQYALRGPDGVRLLQFGKLRGHVAGLLRSQVAYRLIIDGLPAEGWDLVGDLPGGTRQAFNGWGDFADRFLVVTEPSAKSILTARRLSNLRARDPSSGAMAAIANKVRVDGDAALVARRTGLEVIGEIPWDLALAEAERTGTAPIDAAPDSPAVLAVGSLVNQMTRGGE